MLKIIKLDKGKETDLMRGPEEESCVSHRSAVKTAEEGYSPLHHRLLKSSERPPKSLAYTLPEVTLSRVSRICGQIGESVQKDKLSYLSLVRQVEMGTKKGHSEAEINEAVIRAVSPGLLLRDMLEIKRGLTLPALLTILRGHYKVDSSTACPKCLRRRC